MEPAGDPSRPPDSDHVAEAEAALSDASADVFDEVLRQAAEARGEQGDEN